VTIPTTLQDALFVGPGNGDYFIQDCGIVGRVNGLPGRHKARQPRIVVISPLYFWLCKLRTGAMRPWVLVGPIKRQTNRRNAQKDSRYGNEPGAKYELVETKICVIRVSLDAYLSNRNAT